MASKEERIAQRRLIVQRKREERELALTQSSKHNNEDKTAVAEQPVVITGGKLAERQANELILSSKRQLLRFQINQEDIIASQQSDAQANETIRALDQKLAKVEFEQMLAADASKLQEQKTAIDAAVESFDATSKNPYSIQEQFDAHKLKCQAFLDIKLQHIKHLQAKIDQHDAAYQTEIQRQAGVIDDLVEKMRDEKKRLKKLVDEELESIEKELVKERHAWVQQFTKEWETLSQQRRLREQEQLERHEFRAVDHIEKFEKQVQDESEDFLKLKIKLDTEVHVLEQQLQKMKAVFHLNTEKLEYNYQVLKKREEENAQTIVQQKRKINKLNDVLASLSQKTTKLEESLEKDLRQSNDDYDRIWQQYQEFHSKFQRVQNNDAKTYYEIHEMNLEDLVKNYHWIQEANSIFWRDLVGLNEFPNSEWTQFDDQLKQILANNQNDTAGSYQWSSAVSREEVSALLSSPDTQKVLELLIAQLSDLFIETKLAPILETLPQEERRLLQLDAIFKAMRFESPQDVHDLKDYFKKESGEWIPTDQVVSAVLLFQDQRRNRNKKRSVDVKANDVSNTELQVWNQLEIDFNKLPFDVWASLKKSMEDYYTILVRRDKARQDIQQLWQENSELETLIHGVTGEGEEAEIAKHLSK